MTDDPSRRYFIKTTLTTAGGVLIGCKSSPDKSSSLSIFGRKSHKPIFKDFVEIDPSGNVTVLVDRTEMGQGTTSAYASIIGEELGLNPSLISVKNSPVDPIKYRNRYYNFQLTGGSTSTASAWRHLRQVGAYTREKFISAANKRWGNSPHANATMRDGYVESPGKPKLHLAELLSQALKEDDPEFYRPKSAPFRFLGKVSTKKNQHAIVTGEKIYSTDIYPEGVLYAFVMQAPQPGSYLKVDSIPREYRRGMPRVIALPEIPFEDTKRKRSNKVDRVVVIHHTYWQARQLFEKIKHRLVWNNHSSFSSEQLESEIIAKAKNARHSMRLSHKNDEIYPDSKISHTYSVPYLPHLTMEPMNCVAHVSKSGCEVWVGSQFPHGAYKLCERVTGLKGDFKNPERSKIKVHNMRIGGGFGRKGSHEHVVTAVQASMIMGKPIKVIWSREEDIAQDHFRPMAACHLQAEMKNGRLVGITSKMASHALFYENVYNPYLSTGIVPKAFTNRLGKALIKLVGKFVNNDMRGDSFAIEGLKHQYSCDNQIFYSRFSSPVRAGFWRSIGYSHGTYFLESFVDEVAHHLKRRPGQFRLDLLNERGSKRNKRVLETVIKSLDETKFARQGEGVGYAQFRFSPAVLSELPDLLGGDLNTYVAAGVLVAGSRDRMRIKKIVLAVDCGFVLNPEIVIEQIMGGCFYALGAALQQKITFADGFVREANFHQVDSLRMMQTPEIEVKLVGSKNADQPPTGVGEVAVPVVAPALCNAIFNATGLRIRSLPVNKHIRI